MAAASASASDAACFSAALLPPRPAKASHVHGPLGGLGVGLGLGLASGLG